MAQLPTPGVALAAVPDVGARRWRRARRAGYVRDWLWSRCACEGDHAQRQFESNISPREPMIARIGT